MENGGSRGPAVRWASTLRRDELGASRSLQALLEPLDLAGRVDDRLLAREERVAVRADVDAQLRAGGTDRPLGAARAAVDLGLVILGMDIGLHVSYSPSTPSVPGLCPAGGRRAMAVSALRPWQPQSLVWERLARPRPGLRQPRREPASCSWWRARTGPFR